MKPYMIMMFRGWYYVYRLTDHGTYKRLDHTASRTYQQASQYLQDEKLQRTE